MPDAVLLGPLAIPPGVLVGLIAFLITSTALRTFLPRRFDRASVTWVADTLPVALLVIFLTWKLWPLFSWWDVIRADPILLLRMPGGIGGVLVGSAFAAIPLLRGIRVEPLRIRPLAATILVAIVSFALSWAVLSTALGRSGPASVADDSSLFLELDTLDGRSHSLLDGDRPTMITFWATWCGPCVSELPIKEAFFREHKSDLNYLYVNMIRSESSVNHVRAFVVDRGIDAPVILDTYGELASFFGVRGTPTTVFLDRNGSITERWMGPADLGRLNRALAASLP